MGGATGYAHTPNTAIQRVSHLDLKAINIVSSGHGPQGQQDRGGEPDDRTPMNSFMLSPSTMGRLQGATEQKAEPTAKDEEEEAADDMQNEEV